MPCSIYCNITRRCSLGISIRVENRMYILASILQPPQWTRKICKVKDLLPRISRFIANKPSEETEKEEQMEKNKINK